MNPIVFEEELESTNTSLRRLALAGAPEGTAVAAKRQTGGRGRMGRSFSSPEGFGLKTDQLRSAASVLRRTPRTARSSPRRGGNSRMRTAGKPRSRAAETSRRSSAKRSASGSPGVTARTGAVSDAIASARKASAPPVGAAMEIAPPIGRLGGVKSSAIERSSAVRPSLPSEWYESFRTYGR